MLTAPENNPFFNSLCKPLFRHPGSLRPPSWPPRYEGAVELPNLGNSTGGVNSLRLRLAAKPPPSKRGRQGGRSIPPLQGQRTKVVSLRGAKRRGNLPVQLYGHIGTDVEATPYREIPTDGIAVLGMTYFYLRAPIWAFPAREVKGGSRPSPTIIPSRPPHNEGGKACGQ